MKIRFLGLIAAIYSTCSIAALAEPVAWWSFDQDEGSQVRDLTGNGHDGTIHGPVERVPGLSGRALSFPGDPGAHVSVRHGGSLDFDTAMTLEAWVKRTDTGTRWDGIISNGAGNRGYQLFHSEIFQTLMLYINTDEQGYASVGGEHIPIGEWMHVAAVFDSEAEVARLYQNGRLTGERAFRGRIANHPEEFQLGASRYPFDGYRGLLDEVKLYGRALSAEEIADSYAEFAGALPEPSPAPEPVFGDLVAELDGEDVRFRFSLLEPDEPGAERQVSIYRNSHPRNDRNPGAGSADRVFRGTIESTDGETFEYLDESGVEHGTTYYYWVTPDGRNFRVFPAKMRVRHPEIWWNTERIDAELEAVAERFPGKVELRQVGETVEGRPLRALFAGNPERRVVLIGAVHVSESGPELIVPAVERVLEENPGLLEHTGIAALPCVTLDERERKLRTGYAMYLRKNANGVDLNRSFDAWWRHAVTDPEVQTYQGEEPGAEPETQAVMALLEQSNPAAVFSFHSVASIANAFYLYTGFADQEGDEEYVEHSREVARIYTEGMYGDKWEEYMIFRPSQNFGTVGAYVYKEYGVPSFDLELDNYEVPHRYVRGDAVSPELMEEFRHRHHQGLEALLRAFAEGELGE